MGISVGTIFKWYSPDDADEDGEPIEGCENGQCIGIVKSLIETVEPLVSVKWWEMCEKHKKTDESGTGPYGLAYIWQIGQLY